MAWRRGYTLVEVIISILLSAIMISAVFSVALTSKQGGAKGGRKLAASQASQTVLQRLKNYVTADTGTPALAPGGSWSFHNPPTCVDSQGAVYALMPGSHTITGSNCLVPSAIAGAPYNGTVKYFVAWYQGNALNNGACYAPGVMPGPTCRPSINVTVDWNEP